MKKITFYILTVLLIASCEDVIEVDLNEEDTGLYAVEAKITSIDEPYVFLTKGLPVSADEDFKGIRDAIVTVTDNSVPANTVVLIEDQTRDGLYVVPADINYYGVIGREYTITIKTEGNELKASELLLPVSTIDSIAIWPSLRGDKRFLGIFMYGQEPEGLGNYYKWDIYINGTLANDASILALADDEFVDGNYITALEIFTDYYNPHNAQERRLKFEDEVYVNQISLTEFSYNYFTQLLEQSMGGMMFSVPAANIKSNFSCSNGKEVLGLFTAHDVSTSNTVIINNYIEDQLVE